MQFITWIVLTLALILSFFGFSITCADLNSRLARIEKILAADYGEED